jgi:hypothetical protein
MNYGMYVQCVTLSDYRVSNGTPLVSVCVRPINYKFQFQLNFVRGDISFIRPIFCETSIYLTLYVK